MLLIIDEDLKERTELPTLMERSIENKNIDNIQKLIDYGVRERPIDIAIKNFSIVRESHLFDRVEHSLSALGIKYLKVAFDDVRIKLNSQELNFQVVLLLLINPTHNLELKLNELKINYDSTPVPKYLYTKDELYSPFFSWAALNDRGDLFSHDFFVKFFKIFPSLIKNSIKNAILAGSINFLKEALNLTSWTDDDYLEFLTFVPSLSPELAIGVLEVIKLNIEASGKTIEELTDSKVEYNNCYHDPYYWALSLENTEVIKYFLSHKLKEHKRDDYGVDFSSLILAAKMGDLEIVNLFAEAGFDINAAAGYSKVTPLHVAFKCKHYEIAKYLIKKGADTEKKDYENKTALDRIKDDAIKNEFTDYIICHSIINKILGDLEIPTQEFVALSQKFGENPKLPAEMIYEKISLKGAHEIDIIFKKINLVFASLSEAATDGSTKVEIEKIIYEINKVQSTITNLYQIDSILLQTDIDKDSETTFSLLPYISLTAENRAAFGDSALVERSSNFYEAHPQYKVAGVKLKEFVTNFGYKQAAKEIAKNPKSNEIMLLLTEILENGVFSAAMLDVIQLHEELRLKFEEITLAEEPMAEIAAMTTTSDAPVITEDEPMTNVIGDIQSVG